MASPLFLIGFKPFDPGGQFVQLGNEVFRVRLQVGGGTGIVFNAFWFSLGCAMPLTQGATLIELK